MHNIKIRSKLLMAFGLLLILFGAAVFFSWLSLRRVMAESRALAEGGVAALHFNTQVERDTYEFFMAVDDYRDEEEQENWESVMKCREVLDAHLKEAGGILLIHPDRGSVKIVFDEFGTAYE